MLFSGMTLEEIDQALELLQASRRHYHRGERILSAGEITTRIGLVLQGRVTIESNDIWGNRTIIGSVECGEVFAEAYAILQDAPLLVDVVASEACQVLFLQGGRTLAEEGLPKSWTGRYIANLLCLCARKNLQLSGRSFHTAPRTIRGRVMSYLNSLCLQKHSRSFTIPFDRQQMADYLNLERSALSKELGRMRREGLIDFRKNRFVLLQAPD